jgi:hypothetical protein
MDVRLPDGTIIQNVPEGTTRAQLMEKLKANGMDVSSFASDPAKPQSKQEIYEDTVKKRGWGSGVGPAIDELGGKVTDLTGSPEAGGVTNFVANAVPAALTSGRTAANSMLEAPAKWLMKTAVKPSAAMHPPKQIQAAMGDMLKENIYPTPGGMEKAGNIARTMNTQVDAAVAQSPATAKVSDIAARLDDPMKKFGMQANPQPDTAAIEDVWTKFLTNPHIAGKSEIPVQLAHEMKKGTYSALNGKYGEVGSAATEGQKALARGMREEVATAVPSMVESLKREASMMNIRDVAMQRAMTQGNNNPFGFAAMRLDHLPSATLTMADRLAAVRAFVAMQMYGGSKAHVLAPLGMSAGALEQDPGVLYRK